MTSFVHSPTSVEEAVGLLSSIEGARPIAGGASLVAMMNARLVEPSCVVSFEHIDGLRGVALEPDGAVRIGAMTRHRETAASPHLKGAHALLSQAASVIANRPVRNMGTLGGALANADPAADYLPALRCLDAEIEIAGPTGRRLAPMSGFIVGWYETALEPGEIITAIRLPALPPGPTLYRKLARVSGDYATISCAARLEGHGPSAMARIAIGGCGPGPLRDEAGEQALRGSLGDSAAVAALGASLQALSDPIDDVRGTAEYRRRLIPRVVAAAILQLLEARADG